MARRQSEVLRNLDDSLRVLNVLTLRSCGLVVMLYGVASALELAFGLWGLLAGPWGVLMPLLLAGVAAVVLSWVERHDDEHYVPSAIRYVLERPWRYVYGGCAMAPTHPCRVSAVLRERA